jgi:peptidoglycan/LPS O-acetylase OafA/YrhL
MNAGIAITALTFYLFLAKHYGFAMTVFGYPLLALGFALLIVAALGDGLLRRTRIPGAGKLALWSYAIYLTHKQACILLAEPLAARGFDADSAVAIGVSMLVSVLSGWVLFRLVETPFMMLRDRYLPSNLRAPAALSAQPR